MDIKGGAIVKPLRKKREKKSVPSLPVLSDKIEKGEEVHVKASLQPDHLLFPHGQLLRGVAVQGRGEYKLPLVTDVPSFATRQRTKK